jgi:cyanate lyase
MHRRPLNPNRPRKRRPSISRAVAFLRRKLIGEEGAPPLEPLLRSTARRSASRFVFTHTASQGGVPMRREELTEKILDIKREKGWTWKRITDEIGGMSPVLVVGALLGQMKLVKPLAKKAAGLFGLSPTEERMLNEVPNRGTQMPPTDPLIYRFYELVMVIGPAWKALIEEEFGDGIMSAIDFDMDITRKADPKGDRVSIGLSGKFLPYKYYGATGNALAYGLKEE